MTKRRMITVCALLCGLILVQPSPVNAKTQSENLPPEIYQKLLQCRSAGDAQERLACYDSNVLALQQAQDRGEVVIVGREEVREAKKGLFGLSLPNIKLFGGSKDEEVSELESTIASARQYTPGRWRITLQDGAIWDQVDDSVLVGTPSNGDKIVIKRAAFGSFKGRINNEPGIRLRRIQ